MNIGHIEETGIIEPIEEPRLEPVPEETPPELVPAEARGPSPPRR